MTQHTEQGSNQIYGTYRGRSYIRYSSHMQDDGFSVEYQIAEIEAFCEKHNIEMVNHHIDQAQTATKVAGREEFFRLIDAVKAGEVDVIVIYKLNRMFRNSYESQKYRQLFRKHGVKLMSVTQMLDEDTSSGRLTANILSDIDQYQSETISDHVKSSMREMARQGYFTGGVVPYGYALEAEDNGTKTRKRYVIDETEAQHVREMFQLYADGHTLRHIHEYTKENELTSRRRMFSTSTILRMLKSDFYIGTKRYKTQGYDEVVVKDAVPAIVSQSLWERVNARHAESKKQVKPRKRRSLYPLTGKIECGKCGSHFFGTRATARHKDEVFEYRYYVCQARHVYTTCDCKRIHKSKLETMVLSEIKRSVLNEKDMERIAHEIVAQLANSPTDITDEIKQLEKRQKEIYAALDELFEMRIAKEMPPAFLRQKSNAFEEELAGITKRLFALSEQKRFAITYGSILEHLTKLLEYASSDNEEVLKVLFDNIVEKIIIANDRVDIYLRVYPRQTFLHKGTSGNPNVALYTKIQLPK